MSTPLPLGKVPAALLGRMLASLPSASSDGVLLGPAVGEDAAAIELPAGVLVVAADPITLTGRDVGRHCVVVNANDVAVMGAEPRWFLATVLLPSTTTEADVEALFAGLRDACAQVGAALVGGHTEISDAVRAPIVAGTMLGVAPRGGRIITSSGARAGDVVVQIGAVPVEGAAVLADDVAATAVDAATLRRARGALEDPGISVVAAALQAADLGATAMHDPTEGGLASGLWEVAVACGNAIDVDRDAVRWFAPGLAVCTALGCDPWATLASGCVVATFPADAAPAAVTALAAAGWEAAPIGRVRAGAGVYDEGGDELPWPDRDEVARLRDDVSRAN